MIIDKYLNARKMINCLGVTFPKNLNLTEDLSLEFFKRFYQSFQRNNQLKEFENPYNSPDVLILGKNDLNAKELSEVFLFQESSPLAGTHKFCFIHSFEESSSIIQNKLLKIIEEPLNNLCIIYTFLNQHSLLQTIKSRSTTITLHPDDLNFLKMEYQKSIINDDTYQNFEKILSTSELSDFIKKYQNLKNEKGFLKFFFSKASSQKLPSGFLGKILNLSKWLNESLTYHNPKSERAFFIYQAYKAIQSNQK